MARFRWIQLIPLTMMLALASLTFWLLQINQPGPQTEVARSKTHLPDYFVNNFSITLLNTAGQTHYRINAATMVHYEDDQATEVALPMIYAFTPGQPTVITIARRGTINHDGSVVNLYGDAQVTRLPSENEPAMEANSEHFRVLVNDDVVMTEKPVKLSRGGSMMAASGMIYNNVSRELRLSGQVRGMIIATDLSPTGHSFR